MFFQVKFKSHQCQLELAATLEPCELFNVIFLAATGVLVGQSSGMRYAKSSMPTACRFGAVHVKLLGTAPISKSQ